MSAYNEWYLEDATCNLGEFFDYMVHDLKVNIDQAFEWLAYSATGHHFENGNPAFLGGMSGVELARKLIYELTGDRIATPPTQDIDRSPEYWTGWSLANYQWRSERRFSEMIEKGLTASRVCDMYILHEADASKFYETAEVIISESEQMKSSRIKRLRAYYGYTQKQLSEASGVSLRMIQLYEQGQNDLSKAQADVVKSLAKSLGCTMEDLV